MAILGNAAQASLTCEAVGVTVRSDLMRRAVGVFQTLGAFSLVVASRDAEASIGAPDFETGLAHVIRAEGRWRRAL